MTLCQNIAHEATGPAEAIVVINGVQALCAHHYVLWTGLWLNEQWYGRSKPFHAEPMPTALAPIGRSWFDEAAANA